MEINKKLELMVIKSILVLKKFINRDKLKSGEEVQKNCILSEVKKYLFTSNKIGIQLYQKDEKNKELILEMIQLLGTHGIEIELTEFEQIFTNKDMLKILEKNSNTKINLRYMIKSYFMGTNTELEYDITTYCEIIKKIEYLVKVTKVNFKSQDEQVIFVMNQLADYISYDENYKSLSTKEFKERSSLKGALIDRKTVCMGFSMAFERCLLALGINCNIVCGKASKVQPNKNKFFEENHAWNQVELENQWYNADIMWFSTEEEEEKKIEYILVSDDEFKKHYTTGTYQTFKCKKTYKRREELYKKVKNIKNILKAYDLGKRDTILQYKVENGFQEFEDKQVRQKTQTKNLVDDGKEEL